jgi:uncharacterized protein (DUF1501 family)
MTPTRRDFLRMGFGSSALLALGAAAPRVWADCAAHAHAKQQPAGGRVLVVLELSGGNDGLNTVIPYRDDDYRRHRPRIHVPVTSVHRIDDRIGFHPQLGGFARLLEGRQLAIVQGVGYPNTSRSHFFSMAVWQTARLQQPEGQTQGWLNRCLGLRARADGGDAPAMHISGQSLPQALAGSELHVPTLNNLEQVRRRLGMPEGGDVQAQRAALDRIGSLERGEPGSDLQFVQRSSLISYRSSARIEEVLRGNSAPAGGYPTNALGERFRLMAQLIKLGLTTAIYYTSLDGFDTHASQLATHPGLLLQVGDSLRAFLADLATSGDAGRVLVLVYSEFGRRLADNAAGGTDHGAAAPVFLLGDGIRPGVHGPYPNLQDLSDGDLRVGIDFRRVYATVLDRWLGCRSETVLGERFEHLPILAAGK